MSAGGGIVREAAQAQPDGRPHCPGDGGSSGTRHSRERRPPWGIITSAYDAFGKQNVQGFVDFMKGQIPLGRVGEDDEIASAVAFLASDGASYIIGIELFVDGGMTQV